MSQHQEREAERLTDAVGAAEHRLSDERLRLAIESTGSMIYDYDFTTHAVYRSDVLRELFRWDDVEPTDEWWITRIHPDDLERVRRTILPAVQAGVGSRWEVEYRFRRGDGSYATVLERGNVVRDAASCCAPNSMPTSRPCSPTPGRWSRW